MNTLNVLMILVNTKALEKIDANYIIMTSVYVYIINVNFFLLKSCLTSYTTNFMEMFTLFNIIYAV